MIHNNSHSKNLKIYNEFDDKCKYIYTIIGSLQNKQNRVTSDLLMLQVDNHINNIDKRFNKSKYNSRKY